MNNYKKTITAAMMFSCLTACKKSSEVSPNTPAIITIDRAAKEKDLNTKLSLQPNSEIPT